METATPTPTARVEPTHYLNDGLPPMAAPRNGISFVLTIDPNGRRRLSAMEPNAGQFFKTDHAVTDNYYEALIGALTPAHRINVRDLLDAVLDGEPAVQFEGRVDADNNGKWIRLLAHRSPLGPGTAYVILFDITDQIQAYRQVHEDASRLQLAMDATEDAIWDWDLVTNSPTFSDRYYRMLGYEPGEFPASYESWRALVHPEDLVDAERTLHDHFTNRRETYSAEFRMKAKNGGFVWVLSRGRVITRDAEGKALRMVGVHSDISEQKLIEQGIRESEHAYRAMFDQSPFTVTLRRLNGPYVDVNRQMLTLSGLDRSELIGRTPLELGLYDPETNRQFNDRLARDKSMTNFEIVSLLGGQMRNLLMSARVIDINGEPHVLTVGNDITERKKAENALAKSQVQLKGLTDNLPGVIYQFDLKPDRTYHLRYISGKVEQILGFSKDSPDLIANLISRIDPRDIEEFRRSLYASLAAMSQWHFEGRYLRQNGEISWFKMLSTPHIEDDQVVFDGILLDVTDLVEAQIKLRDSETMLKAVIETIPGRVFWKDHDLRYLGCNSSFARDAGVTRPEDLVGVDDFALGWKDQAELYRADDSRVMDSGTERLNYEEPQTTPDGNTIWLRTSKVPLRDASGSVIGVLGTYQDITEHKKMEEQLARGEKMQALGLLAGGVAHDLNNTLGPLVGYPELMLRQIPEGSPLRKMVLRIERAAIDAVDVIQDLLTLARRGRYELKPISLNDVVLSYLDSSHFLRISTEKPGITLNQNLAAELPLIQGSTAHLSKVIMNLVGNAYEAMEEPASLTITTQTVELSRLESGASVTTPGLYNLLRIKDTGCGIAREDLHKIFEPYFSRKSMGRSGTGLGLAVVYGVVKDHNGYYDVFSEVGKGTEFVFYFPVSTENAEIEAEVENQNEPVRGKILVVDDSVEQREMAHQMIAGLGYEVDSVTNGHEALKYLAANPVDLVVLDMVMEKDFDGLSTYEAIIKVRPGQRAVVVSGFSDMDRVHKMQALGAGPFIRKPYTMKALGEALAETLRKPR